MASQAVLDEHSGSPTLEQIASQTIITIERGATLQEAASLMGRRRVSGLIVVNRQGESVGVLSLSDLVRYDDQGAQNRAQGASSNRRGRDALGSRDDVVADVMSPLIISLEADRSVVLAAKLMAESRVHRILVEKEGKPFGVVTLMDVARLVGEIGLYGSPAPQTSRPLHEVVKVDAPRKVFLSSLQRCEEKGDFGKRFYKHFMASSPEVYHKFAAVDLKKQQEKVVKAIRLASDVALGRPKALSSLKEQAELHSRRHLDVRPELYGLWLECLITTVQECDPCFDPGVEHSWRLILGHVAGYMARRY